MESSNMPRHCANKNRGWVPTQDDDIGPAIPSWTSVNGHIKKNDTRPNPLAKSKKRVVTESIYNKDVKRTRFQQNWDDSEASWSSEDEDVGTEAQCDDSKPSFQKSTRRGRRKKDVALIDSRHGTNGSDNDADDDSGADLPGETSFGSAVQGTEEASEDDSTGIKVEEYEQEDADKVSSDTSNTPLKQPEQDSKKICTCKQESDDEVLELRSEVRFFSSPNKKRSASPTTQGRLPERKRPKHSTAESPISASAAGNNLPPHDIIFDTVFPRAAPCAGTNAGNAANGFSAGVHDGHHIQYHPGPTTANTTGYHGTNSSTDSSAFYKTGHGAGATYGRINARKTWASYKANQRSPDNSSDHTAPMCTYTATSPSRRPEPQGRQPQPKAQPHLQAQARLSDDAHPRPWTAGDYTALVNTLTSNPDLQSFCATRGRTAEEVNAVMAAHVVAPLHAAATAPQAYAATLEKAGRDDGDQKDRMWLEGKPWGDVTGRMVAVGHCILLVQLEHGMGKRFIDPNELGPKDWDYLYEVCGGWDMACLLGQAGKPSGQALNPRGGKARFENLD
ncbi:hypothetical protein K490DRAFT_59905 [Saccharata proteae CBS 121410]|uniref:Uncharacterized protein n=1 Tax=Saccharata proteae CBS 121410 TaxID=1314787 RepID=A0A9P4HP41_9PEZI|nr:hypothetical protein K490DRAFT_59905 [Saccharata proteae CBS 121410]